MNIETAAENKHAAGREVIAEARFFVVSHVFVFGAKLSDLCFDVIDTHACALQYPKPIPELKETVMKITLWQRTRAWFKDSETIFLARFQMLAGILLTVIATFDPSVLAPLIGDKWFGPFLLAWGVIAEAARRYRATDLK